ncbi:MAG: ribonuclease E/G [Alphaproteobacteria bacterium]|nr:ribonuclease E/G [Alphaproteobacteria bacterium]MBV9966076.1 ribonuclease E/G [Alphaproteobacteria bacterium]
MSETLLIAVGPGEWRAAWLERGDAVELYVERGDTPPAGSIHLGRVVRRTPGLDAVLVDIGMERPGFLPVRDASAAPPLGEGARILVEVRREAQQGKGARLSARIKSRPGGPKLDKLISDADRHEPPHQLDPPTGFANTIAVRLPGHPEQVLTDDAAVVPELRNAFPNAAIAHKPAEDWPIDLDAAFAMALAPSVTLPGGGSLHIAETAAAVLIDVDTGTPDESSAERGALAANLSAVQAIARQLRLRQLGGGIVADFVGLEGRGAREKVRAAMVAALAGDPAEPRVLGWTRLGHLEIVRPRRGRPLSEAMVEPQGIGKTSIASAFEALRLLQREARAQPAANWRLVVSPAVGAVLRGSAAGALQALEARLGREIAVTVEPNRERAAFDIVAR